MLEVCGQVTQVQLKENYLFKGKIEITLSGFDIQIDKLLISSNEQFLALILSRGYNNVEEMHKLFIIYDLNTTKQISLGSWTSFGALNQRIQHEFDGHSKFFIQIQQDMVSIVNLQQKTLKNFLVVGVQKFLDIDDDNQIYLQLFQDGCLCVIKYSINQEQIMSYFAFGNNINSLKIMQNFILMQEMILDSFYLCLYLKKNKKSFPKKKIKLNCLNIQDFFILQNQFLVELYQQEEERKEVRLREIRSGKIIRTNEDISGLFYQLVVDKNDAFLFLEDENNKIQKFDFLKGKMKEHLLQKKGQWFTFGKRIIVFSKGEQLNLKFIRFL
ncbi:unnamed protein product [Paramecium pentaurelia]|uniref:Uncharacterized protein n=1 Tax=Paramecium pentaurelia TaxID=43138 RepID=A0A8S1TM56_9CILI|nr:unnamed protein product [Paramecium pentaurelia]